MRRVCASEEPFPTFLSSCTTHAHSHDDDRVGPPPVKILVVEDEAPTAEFLHRGLTEEGFAVDLAADAAAADEAVAVNEYDAIVLDVLLPGGDGFALCQRWRARASPLRSSFSRPATRSPTACAASITAATTIW